LRCKVSGSGALQGRGNLLVQGSLHVQLEIVCGSHHARHLGHLLGKNAHLRLQDTDIRDSRSRCTSPGSSRAGAGLLHNDFGGRYAGSLQAVADVNFKDLAKFPIEDTSNRFGPV